MKAVLLQAHCKPEDLLLSDIAEPVIKANEVLVELKAVAMNHLDLWVRKGLPGHKFPLPLILGSDGAGVITELGDCVPGHFKIGDRVAIMPGVCCDHCEHCFAGEHQLCRHYGVLGETCHGTNAEYIAVPSNNLLSIPAEMSFEDAASVPLVFLTAWHMLCARATVKPGDLVLVHGAGSGVSVACIQIAKLFGATVITTTSSEAKMAKAKILGADYVINYREQSFVDEVKQISQRSGVDIVIDHVGEATWQGSLSCLKKGGTVVTCGTTTGPDLQVHGQLLFFKGLSILGSTMGSRSDMLTVFNHVAAGRMHAVVDKTFALSEIATAHAYLENADQFGKVVLIP